MNYKWRVPIRLQSRRRLLLAFPLGAGWGRVLSWSDAALCLVSVSRTSSAHGLSVLVSLPLTSLLFSCHSCPSANTLCWHFEKLWHSPSLWIFVDYSFLSVKIAPFIDFTIPWLFAQLFFSPLYISVKSSNNTSVHYPFFFSYFHMIFRSLWPQLFLYASRDQSFCKAWSLVSFRLGSATLDVHWLNAPGLNSLLSLNSKQQFSFTCCIIAHRLKFCYFCFEFPSFTGFSLLFWASGSPPFYS